MEIRTDIQIDAPAARVWSILTDFDAYPAWNPFIRLVEGRAEKGSQLHVRLDLPRFRSIEVRPRIIHFDPGRELRWIGQLLLPGFFDGEHVFAIEPIGDVSVRFVQRERFIGIGVPFLSAVVRRPLIEGFEEMNEALKERTEALEIA